MVPPYNKLFALFLCAIVLAIIAIRYSRQQTIKKMKELRWKDTVESCTRGDKSTATIFMIVLCRGPLEYKLAAETLHSMFEQSACPMHLTVGVYEVVKDLRAPSEVLSLYSANRTKQWDHSQRIKIMKVPISRAMTPDVARGFVLRHAYGGQAFVGLIATGAILLPAWDSTLLDARRNSANPLSCIVAPLSLGSTVSTEDRDTRLEQNSYDDHWSEMIASIGQSMEDSGKKHADIQSIDANFLYISSSTYGVWPKISSRPFARKELGSTKGVNGVNDQGESVTPIPSLFWTGELTLAPASAFVREETEDAETGSSTVKISSTYTFGQGLRDIVSLRVSDYVTSCEMWTRGWDFYTPLSPVAVWSSLSALENYDSGGMQDIVDLHIPKKSRRTLQDYIEFSSTSPLNGEAYVRAVLGVSPKLHHREIVAKYGSVSGFQAEKEAVILDIELATAVTES